MDEETMRMTDSGMNQQPKGKGVVKKVLVFVLVLLLVAGAAGGAYWWRDSVAMSAEKEQASDIAKYKSTIADLKKELAEAKTVDSSEPCTEVAPKVAVLDNIKASVTSGNTAALAGYMASTVNVILAATEAYGPQTAAQAVESISDFISADSTSWDYDFSLATSVLSGYQSGDYKQYFPDTAVVGKASNKQVISFSFDCDGKIDTVFMQK